MVVSGDFIPREVKRISKPRHATAVDNTVGQGDLVRREAKKGQLTKQGPVMGDVAHHINVSLFLAPINNFHSDGCSLYIPGPQKRVRI